MLVLSRKNGEEIVIDDCIRVKVLEVRGQRVRLGIVAPEFVSIFRGELVGSPSEDSIDVDHCVVQQATQSPTSPTELENAMAVLP